jgi:hypothetical protein
MMHTSMILLQSTRRCKNAQISFGVMSQKLSQMIFQVLTVTQAKLRLLRMRRYVVQYVSSNVSEHAISIFRVELSYFLSFISISQTVLCHVPEYLILNILLGGEDRTFIRKADIYLPDFMASYLGRI